MVVFNGSVEGKRQEMELRNSVKKQCEEVVKGDSRKKWWKGMTCRGSAHSVRTVVRVI